ncbi:hypothetical protein T265_08281 [Opisthorchis viverrini]|uniref:Uncharacterized protein n=1 Tax=Opisthorchis viverrini TaxID=6198 RepID=A0A075A8T4_OPIVI|nr:hypothetical protein T265_08281 [Opisthorchis viverrini]KER23914.1 hypothetical protein T265_08281 [Opisthorchis viverrini]
MCCTRPPHVSVATAFEIPRYMYIFVMYYALEYITDERFSCVPGCRKSVDSHEWFRHFWGSSGRRSPLVPVNFMFYITNI